MSDVVSTTSDPNTGNATCFDTISYRYGTEGNKRKRPNKADGYFERLGARLGIATKTTACRRSFGWPGETSGCGPNAMTRPWPKEPAMMAGVSIIVPCYNEEEVLPEFYKRSIAAADAIEGWDHEWVFVNDCSSDRTSNILAALAVNDSRVKVINLARNRGHQVAVTAWLDFAHGDAVVIIDADRVRHDALNQRFFTDQMTAEENQREHPVDDGGFPLNEHRILERQRGAAEQQQQSQGNDRHLFDFAHHNGCADDLGEGDHDRSQGGQVNRIADYAGGQVHQRHPVVDAENQSIRQVEIELVQDEKYQDRKEIEELFHEDGDFLVQRRLSHN